MTRAMTTHNHQPGQTKPRPASTPEERPHQSLVPATEKGVADMAAIELGERQEIQEGDQDAEPGGDTGRVEPQGHFVTEAGPEHGFEETIDERFPELEIGALNHRFPDLGRHDPVGEKRHQGHKAGDRARGADIEKLPLVLDRVLDPDHRTEGSDAEDRDRKWNEIGGRGGQSMPSSRDVVAELMAPQNCQQRDGEFETGDIDPWDRSEARRVQAAPSPLEGCPTPDRQPSSCWRRWPGTG